MIHGWIYEYDPNGNWIALTDDVVKDKRYFNRYRIEGGRSRRGNTFCFPNICICNKLHCGRVWVHREGRSEAKNWTRFASEIIVQTAHFIRVVEWEEGRERDSVGGTRAAAKNQKQAPLFKLLNSLEFLLRAEESPASITFTPNTTSETCRSKCFTGVKGPCSPRVWNGCASRWTQLCKCTMNNRTN